ncbi:MAG: amidohydrolase [Synergistaceae bacterium]|jgi:predicted amidohydrolase YtcJ|nr:amidohydrolase [Synergistaceae bacterium]
MRTDRVFYNGKIVTVDGAFSVAEAVAVGEGKILAVGSNDRVREFSGRDAEWTDLAGKTMIPGVIDAHGHFGMVVKFAEWADLRAGNYYAPRFLTAAEAVEALKAHKDKKGIENGGYVLGYGYTETGKNGENVLDKFSLDRVSESQPVIVAHNSLHLFSFNSRALALLGVDKNTKDTGTDRIFRVNGEPDGEPNGVIQGPLAQEFIFNFSAGTMEQKLSAFDRAQRQYFEAGITSVQEGKSTPADIEIFDAAAKAGRIGIDILSFVDYKAMDAVLEKYPFRVGETRDHVRICGIKMISDGTLSSGAYLSEPREGTVGDRGIQYIPSGVMEEAIRKALRNGWQICVHAMGDAAVEKLMNIYEKAAREEAREEAAPRPIINHASGIRRDQLRRVKDLGFTLSFYPSACSGFYETFCATLGPKRASAANPLRSALDSGILVTAHNDAPIIGPDPFIILWAAVNRRSVRTGALFGPEERVSVEDGLRLLTINGALQYGEERIKGSIEAGKQADLVILNKDPLSVGADDLRTLRPLETIKDGVTVYRAAEINGEINEGDK